MFGLGVALNKDTQLTNETFQIHGKESLFAHKIEMLVKGRKGQSTPPPHPHNK